MTGLAANGLAAVAHPRHPPAKTTFETTPLHSKTHFGASTPLRSLRLASRISRSPRSLSLPSLSPPRHNHKLSNPPRLPMNQLNSPPRPAQSQQNQKLNLPHPPNPLNQRSNLSQHPKLRENRFPQTSTPSQLPKPKPLNNQQKPRRSRHSSLPTRSQSAHRLPACLSSKRSPFPATEGSTHPYTRDKQTRDS